MAGKHDSKTKLELHDDISENLEKARGICALVAHLEDQAGLPSDAMANAMWAVRDLLEDTKHCADELARRAA